MSTINQTYSMYLTRLSNDISNNMNIIMSAIGIPCNLLSIIIFTRLLRNKTNMGFLGIFQSIIDMLILALFLLVFRSSQLFGTSFAGMNDSLCKFLTFLRRFILHASSWIAVLSTFDRFTFVLYGHDNRLKFMKNKLMLSSCIFAIFTIITILDIPNLFFYVQNRACTGNNNAVISSDIISILLRTYIPFVLMVVFNIFMIRKLFNNTRTTFKQNSLSRKEYQFTLAVMAYDAYFFILNAPLSIYYIMYDINLYSDALKGDDLVFNAAYSVSGAVTSNFSFLVQTFSFFMYVCFNKLYRIEFLRIVGLIFRIKNLGRVQPSGTGFTQTQHTL